jgi:hypothetical protein
MVMVMILPHCHPLHNRQNASFTNPLSHPFFFIAAVVFVPMCLLYLCAHNYGDDEHDVKGNGPITLPLLLPLKDLSTKLQA